MLAKLERRTWGVTPNSPDLFTPVARSRSGSVARANQYFQKTGSALLQNTVAAEFSRSSYGRQHRDLNLKVQYVLEFSRLHVSY
jgi:hypothetical protein